jgi:drug/metabolite transporter (DMT)-like permease
LERARRPDAIGILYIVLTASAYAAMDITAKLAYQSGLTVATLLAVRFFGAGIMLLALAGAIGAKPRLTPRQILTLLVLGSAGYALESFLLNSALRAMAVGPVILIFYSYPALVAVSAVIIGRERMDRFKLAALLLSTFGVATLLAFPTQGMNGEGVAFALGAAVAFATYALVAEHVVKGLHKLRFSGFVMLGAGMSIGAFGVAFDAVHLPIGASSWGWIFLHLGLISIAIVSLMAAIGRLGATRAAIGNTLEPALAVVFAAFVLGERLGPLQIVGGLVLLVALALLPLGGKVAIPSTDVGVLE